MPRKSDDSYSSEEAARLRDAIVKRMIATPPQPHKPLKKKKVPSKGKRT